MIQKRDPFAKTFDRNPFVIAMHARFIGFGKREKLEPISLDFVQP
jgi:hypothetical protein